MSSELCIPKEANFPLEKSIEWSVPGVAVYRDGIGSLIIGRRGYGKTALAACFLSHGYQLVSAGMVSVSADQYRVCVTAGTPEIILGFSETLYFYGNQAAKGHSDEKSIDVAAQFRSGDTTIQNVYFLDHPEFAFNRIDVSELSEREFVLESHDYWEDTEISKLLFANAACFHLSFQRNFQAMEQVVQVLGDSCSSLKGLEKEIA